MRENPIRSLTPGPPFNQISNVSLRKAVSGSVASTCGRSNQKKYDENSPSFVSLSRIRAGIIPACIIPRNDLNAGYAFSRTSRLTTYSAASFSLGVAVAEVARKCINISRKQLCMLVIVKNVLCFDISRASRWYRFCIQQVQRKWSQSQSEASNLLD